MPEGHTIHRLARDQAKTLVGRTLSVTSPQGRFATGAQMLDGRKLLSIDAHGKHLLYDFDDMFLHVHLGLFGKYKSQSHDGESSLPEPRGAVRVRFVSNSHVVDLNGPNQCEVLELQERHDLIGRLGPDPLRQESDWLLAWERVKSSRSTIGQLIMDQSVMAGVGNIYRTELLFRARLSPATLGKNVLRSTFKKLWLDAAALLAIGVKYNRIITVDLDKTDKPATRLRYGERTLIFGKAQCPYCNGPVTRFEIANRRAFRCDTCQPLEQGD